MHHADEPVRMRAADAVEKFAVTNPAWLRPFRVRFIKLAASAKQQELRRHLAQVLSLIRTGSQSMKSRGRMLLLQIDSLRIAPSRPSFSIDTVQVFGQCNTLISLDK